MFSISTTPAKQSATDTITVLSGRLSSATLLEDRRAAILGLRSFAKDFPATVSSTALRGLIGSLTKDGEDVDTVKIVLETLLMLFNPNEDSPEASDEIALWLADEFTQRQENITLLLDFLDSNDFYSRLYPLQLLGAILVARTERTEECVFTAPLGISRVVAILDDHRDAIRNEGISLLTGLTPTSTDIQKLVAFENAFEKTFSIIEADGSLNEGGRTVEDCLIFLANLLRRNPSNQALFRESGGIKRLADLLHSLPDAQSNENGISPWALTQRNRNLFAHLSIVRLLLPGGSAGVLQNQNLLWKYGLCHDILQLAFSSELEIQIKAEALLTCGDMIRDATALQETFAQLTIKRPAVGPSTAKAASEDTRVYIIDGLLDLILNLQDSAAFDLRYAASECLKAYFSNHLDVRLHFLTRAIDGYSAGSEESSNVLTVLLRPASDLSAVDPYRQWFACVITIHLLYDNPTCKAKALAVAEGDSSDGEEVVTSFQTITAHLITGISRGDDSRILIGYLMLLCTWLFEDLDAVNDFLSEGSNVQSLIQAIFQPTVVCNEIVQGLCAMLLGIVYEFSTKDSPISRTALHSMLASRLDRERYLDRLIKLRSHPLLREFETIPQRRDPELIGGQPDVFFDPVFVNFFKDNYGRVSRALDRSPELEISVITNGVQKGISRELVDSLREQLKAKDEALDESKAERETLEARLLQAQADHRQSEQSAAKDLADARSGQDGLQKSHQDELLKLQREQGARLADVERRATALQASMAAKDSDHQKELSQARRLAQADADSVQRRTDAEIADLRATISNLQVDLQKATKDRELEVQAKTTELETRDEEIMALSEQHAISLKEEQTKTGELSEQIRQLQAELNEAQASPSPGNAGSASDQSDIALKQMKQEKEAAQSELDDLLMVFADLEEQVAKQKTRLRELGEAVSDGEEDDWEGQADQTIAETMSSTTESSHGDEAEWLDVEPDEEQLTFVSLFDNESFPDLKSMIAHCKKVNNFDLAATIKSLGLEFHSAVKLVNFIRSLVKEQQPVPEAISATDFDDDKYLKPILENDAVLFSLDEILDEDSPDLDAANPSAKNSGAQAGLRDSKELEAELASVKEQFNNYRLAVERTLDKRWGDDDDNLKKSTIAATKDNSNYYFESYAENEIHETMLKDKVRTDAYRDFIYENKHIFKGKTVLDIGCGTGILSMFCAKAGAEKVIAVDKSAIIEKARENVFNNGLSDKITCLRGAIEDVTLPVDSVDIIVSEWMGYCLLYEAMLPSVLYARDKYLKPDGLLVPSSGTIWLAPVEDPEFVSDHVEYWNDVYGFNMKAMQEGIYDEVRIQTTPGSTVCGDAFPFKVLDLHTIKVEDLSFSAQWSSVLNRPVERLDGFLIWFDNFFATSRSEPVPEAHTTPAMWNKKGRGNIAFTTGPFDPETHWRQGLLLQPSAALKSTEKSVKLAGNITFSALEENVRALKIDLSWAVENEQTQNRSWNLK